MTVPKGHPAAQCARAAAPLDCMRAHKATTGQWAWCAVDAQGVACCIDERRLVTCSPPSHTSGAPSHTSESPSLAAVLVAAVLIAAILATRRTRPAQPATRPRDTHANGAPIGTWHDETGQPVDELDGL